MVKEKRVAGGASQEDAKQDAKPSAKEKQEKQEKQEKECANYK